MAYLKSLFLGCHDELCPRRAEVELKSRTNESLGKYCSKHGRERLQRVKAAEAEADRQDARGNR